MVYSVKLTEESDRVIFHHIDLIEGSKISYHLYIVEHIIKEDGQAAEQPGRLPQEDVGQGSRSEAQTHTTLSSRES